MSLSPQRLNEFYRLPASLLNLAEADVDVLSGQFETAPSSSSKKVLLLCMLVPPNTTLTPGELALTCATIFASS